MAGGVGGGVGALFAELWIFTSDIIYIVLIVITIIVVFLAAWAALIKFAKFELKRSS